MDFILNNWASFLSVISFILSCFALYFNWQNTNINKKKFKNEQDDKKKADIVWEEIKGSRSLHGYKTIQISNIGQSDAKNFQIIINDKELEIEQESDYDPDTEDFTFDGIKVVDTMNNYIPTEINAGFSASLEVITNPLSREFIIVKLIWDDEFEKKREKTFKYIPGNTKLAN
ncbi:MULTISPECIES: hypothetical protein [Bacillus cereus group]|uniref:DUF4352 domain-containing protein n=1 Tax=Bacillus cereus TaxID=1396 RepID=A0AAW7NIF7_BACCE|nr:MULTISPECIES: hypothetical protein [Bacillus cereus group]MDN4873707.1 hypothetical protein [Bacillus cereus]PFE82558.1 hypothetical protein CN320_23175 [Bacillus thuringiensis]